MTKKILIVEDEYKIRRVLKDYLEKEGWNVLEAGDGQQGIDVFRSNKVNLVLLDIMLPKKNGFQVCKEIKETSDVFVMMLTARAEEEDFLEGYGVGGDDYVTKPFNVKILIAKINAILNNEDKNRKRYCVSDNFKYKDLSIDIESRKIFFMSSCIDVTHKEYDLLLYMMKNINIALSREQILDNVWGIDYDGTDRAIDNCIKRLRNKIDRNSLPIKAVRGYGYVFEVR